MGFREFILLLWVSIMLSMVCVSIGQTPYVPIDNHLIDCGSSSNTIVGDRVFVRDDSDSRVLSTPENILATTTINSISAPLGSRIYQTARVYTGDTTYTFPIQRQGRHWIRLHFFPFVYQGYNMTSATFSVAAQQFTLLHDFRPRNSSVVEEFSLNVTTNSLVLSFRPQTGSIAFLNALEVVSVPDELIRDDAQSINPNGNFRGLWWQALKTVYRVNMGGPLVSPQNDTLGRTWTSDQAFLRSRNLVKPVSNVGGVKYQDGGATDRIAPIPVYGTAASMQTAGVPNSNFNITWEFDVESGSDYLVRYHFCDIVSTSLHELYFNVYLASQAVLQDLDLSEKTTQSLGAPYYRDFIVKTSGMTKLSVSVGPSTGVPNAQPNAILNGLEVMKMNNTEGSLDAGVVAISGKKKSKMAVGVIAGVVAGLFVLIAVAIIFFMLCRRRQRSKQSKTWVPFMMNGGNSQSTGGKVPHGTVGTTASNGGYRIPFVILQEATNNFNESWVIGVGGFGKVYKGVLKDGTRIAVKRGNPQSQQGLAEFQTEIEMLSKLRHRHLVSMIGYCDEGSEMILIYEFMENGTLKSHLYGSEFPSMNWKQRLEICIGSARGLHYLHTGSAKAIIHRDVKSANILLDENLMAKVADFGLSKAGPDIDQTHVSTAVKGSFGYLDPEYFRRQQLTEKSDVYSFGVVLFEVLCARPVIDPSLPREMVNLGEWVMKYQRSGKLEQIIDPNLVDKVNPDSLRKFGETAEKCLAEYGVDRPSMADVLWNLEYALQLQEASNQSEPCENSTNQIGDISPLVNNGSFVGTSAPAEQFSSIEDLSGTSMSRVFSQLVKAEGR